MTEFTADWPDDADGGVFRRLAASGFDFSKAWTVDYNVNFKRWPPPAEAIERLKKMYGEIAVFPPDRGDVGHLQFRVTDSVSYERVISIQRRTTEAMRPFGGVCDSWGILH